MPTSRPPYLSTLCQHIIDKNPASVLDIGVGFGGKGMLFREYTDIWNGRIFSWCTRIDGIEIFEKYITSLQRSVYTNIYIGDARRIVPTLGYYDFAFCGDVLEHLPREDALKLIADIRAHSKFSIFVTPFSVRPQGVLYGNVSECHISQFFPCDFQGASISHIENTLVAEFTQ